MTTTNAELLAQFQSNEVETDYSFMSVMTMPSGERYALGFLGTFASLDDAEANRDALQDVFGDRELVLVKRTQTRRYDVRQVS